MMRKLRRRPSEKGLRVDATLESIREEANTKRKTPHSLARFASAGA